MHMRHSCRCALHPGLTLLAVSVVGSVFGIALHVWFEPWTSAIAIAVGSFAGLALSHAFGESVLFGFVAGAAISAFALGLRALFSVFQTVQRAPSMTSSARVWFSR